MKVYKKLHLTQGALGQVRLTLITYSFIHSFYSLSYDRSVASSKANSPQGAI
jgi:hypothetical protein